jgi:signal transduction histidine kinase
MHPSPGAGLGLAGLRGRTEALGGTFAAAPEPENGFAVRARLPIA